MFLCVTNDIILKLFKEKHIFADFVKKYFSKFLDHFKALALILWQKKKVLKVLDLISKERVLFTVDRKVGTYTCTAKYKNNFNALLLNFPVNIRRMHLLHKYSNTKSKIHQTFWNFYLFYICIAYSPFREMRFPLDENEMAKRNPSKFSILYTYFLHRPVNSLGSRKNIVYNVCSTKWKGKKPEWAFILLQIYDISSFLLGHFTKHKCLLLLKSDDVICR